jgi:ferredoxin
MELIKTILDFNDLLKDFPQDIWDIGWLDKTDLENLANAPIKIDYNAVFHVEDNHIGIVFIKHTPRYDYGMDFETEDWFNNKGVFANQRSIHEKKAAVLAGLGQQGRNTVFHSYKFGFDVHIKTYILHQTKVINLPKRRKPNFDFLPQCEGCEDCAKACPVGAIHNEHNNNIWVDFHKCMFFCHYGNHPTIPSIKYGWRDLNHPEISNEELEKIHTPSEMNEAFGISDFESVIHLPDGGLQFVNYPVCRECVSQPKCSKYNGQHPYKWTAELY